MTTKQAVETARHHAMTTEKSMKSSALLCLDSADDCMERGEEEDARLCAIRSLRYSVGIFHSDYAAAGGK